MSKILYILDEFSPLSETFVYNQIKELSYSQEVFVLCNKRLNNESFPFTNYREFSPEKKTIWKWLLYRNIFIGLRNKKIKRQIQEIRKTFKPTSIVIHFGPCFLKNIYNIGQLDIPIFVFFHGYDVSSLVKKSISYRWRAKKALNLSNVYPVAISQAIQQKLEDAFDTQKKFIKYLGIDTDFFNPNNLKNSFAKKRFIQVSRLVSKKGIKYTLEAFALLKKENPNLKFKYSIVGDGPLKEILIEKSIELKLENEVTFLGRKSQKEIKTLLSESDVYVQNSITSDDGDSEGLPISIMEAMSMNLPIIASNHSGIPELVKSKNGILTEERNSASIKLALKNIFYFPIVNNREVIVNHYSLKKSVTSIYELIKSKEG